MRTLAASCAMLIAILASGRAAAEVQPWPTLFVGVPLAKDWSFSTEFIGRLASDDAHASQLEGRFQLGRALGKSVTLWVGYVHVATYNKGSRDGIENQAVEQLSWNVGTIAGARLSSRTRLEQRFQRGTAETAWRVREQVRLAVPLSAHGPNLILWTEPFVDLNRTAAVRQSFDQLRTFAGLNLRLNERADIEFGYLNQYLHRPNGDTSINAVPVVLTYRF